MAGLASALLTWTALQYANRRGLLDEPGERRSHAMPTPRGGGIGLAIVALVALVLLSPSGPAFAWPAAGGLAMVAAVGWWDDHRPLPAGLRLAVHAGAGLLLATAALAGGASPALAAAALLLVPVLVNAWNFMDGIDGLATTQALLVALAFAALGGGEAAMLPLVIAGACLGFLPFNAPRARIFLGDVGSGALGYLVAVLVVLAAAPRSVGAWPLLLLPACAFLVDTGCTLLWRASRRERIWQAHVQHLYQRLSRRIGHPATAALYAGWTLAMIGSMLLLVPAPRVWAWAGVAAAFGTTIVSWTWLHGRLGR